MGFQYRKRVSLGKGLGLNLSRSGFGLSRRTRRGSVSVGRQGPSFSVRLLRGLSFRKRF